MSLLRRFPPLAVLTAAKRFDEPWIGHPVLNRLGLHPARIAFADAAWALRRLQRGAFRSPLVRALRRDGIAVVPDFLPREDFERVASEVRERLEAVEREHPVVGHGDRGFGPKRPFRDGFDRWDGGTLNRFVTIDEKLPETGSVAVELAHLGALASGGRDHPDKISIYQTIYASGPDDPQMRAHRDTFHAAIKLWYFLEDVTAADGPFEYVPRSHRMTIPRLRWEHRRAREAARQGSGGAFRISDAELKSLGLAPPKPYPVRANTLILGDVRGFHHRGAGRPGARRVALYGSFRPSPFVPIPI